MKTEQIAFEDKHYINVPIWCLLDKRLDHFDRLLVGYMAFRYNYFTTENKKYFESTQTIADVFDVHRNTISRALSTLEKHGYLLVTRKKGSSSTYVVNLRPHLTVKPVSQVKQKPAPIQDSYDWMEEDDPF